MQYLIYGLVGYVLLQGIMYIVLFNNFYRLILQYPRYTFKNASEIPKYLLNFAQIHSQQLIDLGFIFCEYLEIKTTVVGDSCLALLFYNPAWHTYALAKISVIYNRIIPIDFSFKTFFGDGEVLITINGFNNSVIDSLPATILQEPCVTTVEQQLKIHQAKIAALVEHKQPKILSPESFVKAITSHEAAYIKHLYKHKKIVKISDPNLYKLTIKAIVRTIYKCHHQAQVNNLLNFKTEKKISVKTPIISIPTELEVDLFKQWQARENCQINNDRLLFKVGIFFSSLVLFILLAKLHFDWRSLWWLIGILLFHELGHFTAMKIYRYHNTSIFFLPFLGAAVSGAKDRATLTEKTIVLLSGSVPGILLGLFLVLVTPDRLYTVANYSLTVEWLIGLNCLNLLPILPLDGGRIVNLLLISRYPYGEAIFKILTIILLVTASIFWKAAILTSLAILLAFSLPQSWKIANIVKYLSISTTSKSPIDQRISDIFQAIALAGYQHLQLDTKFRLVQKILKQEQQPSASWRNKICLTFTYLSCLVMGIWAMKIA